LHPGHSNAVADLPRSYALADFNDFANRLVPKGPWKLRWNMAIRDVNVGVTEPAGTNLDEDLVWARAGFGNFLYLPLLTYRWNNGCSHDNFPSVLF
jgi:hypothetical protein